jgi:tripartite-type tricarboxylate transporter receptor subunit TctC
MEENFMKQKKGFLFFVGVVMLISWPLMAGPNADTSQSAAVKYPVKPIKLIIPSNPGGDQDQYGRLLSKNIEKILGQPLVPVNIAGGSGNVACQQLLEAPADGYTFLIYNLGFFTASVSGKIAYSHKDFDPVMVTGRTDTNIILVGKKSPYKNAADVAKAIKDTPRTVTFSATYGSPSHFHAVALEQAMGGKFKKLDVGSGADKTISLISGQMDVLSSTVGLMKDYIKIGDVRVIGSICAERSELAPEIPTFTEQGYDLGKGFAAYYIILAPKGTPPAIKDFFIGAVDKMFKDEDVKKEFANAYFLPNIITGSQLDSWMQGYADYFSLMKDNIVNDKF